MKDELAFLDYVRRHARCGRGVLMGPGDDAAVLRTSTSRLVLTTDMLLEGTHFTFSDASPLQVGWKAMACNISDVAAMGCIPRFAVVSVGLCAKRPFSEALALHRGLQRCARRYGVSLVGGDCTAWHDGLSISVALLGEVPGGCRPVLRSGARPGDVILVTGTLGGSLLGRHLRVKPRVAEGLALNRRYRIHAMIDISDGLSLDLYRVCRASGVGAMLDGPSIPVSAAARKVARTSGKSPLVHALGDGEDFELLFTCSPAQARRILRDPPCGTRVTAVGRISEAKRLVLRSGDGHLEPLKVAGWEHHFG